MAQIEITKEELNTAGIKAFMGRVRTLPLIEQAEAIFNEFKLVLNQIMEEERLESITTESFEYRLKQWMHLVLELDEQKDSSLILIVFELKDQFFKSLED